MLPILEQRPVTGPSSALALVGDVVAAAVAANSDDAHPTDLAIGEHGKIVLSPSPSVRGPSAADAPELPHTGPTPATLVFSAGAIGAIAALGSIDPAPEDPAAHQEWLEDLVARLLERWGDGAESQEALDWLGRCLAHDQFARPTPNEVMDAFLDGEPPEPAPPPTTIALAHTLGTPISGANTTGITGVFVNRPADPVLPIALVISVAVVALSLATCTCGIVVAQLLGR